MPTRRGIQLDVDAVARLRTLADQAGSQAALAKELGVTPSHVTDLLRGRRLFSERMLAKLGLRRTVIEAKSA